MKTVLRIVITLLFCIVMGLWLLPIAYADLGDYTLPANTTIIEDEAFSNCTWMKAITIPAGVTRIGNGAFSGCTDLTDVYYDGTLEQWGAITFGGNNHFLTAATLHCTLASGSWGSLTWVLDNEGLLSISGKGPMDSFSFLSDEAWLARRNDIKKVIICPGVTSIGDYAFHAVGITSVSISPSVTDIGANAFSDCRSLRTLDVPFGVGRIGAFAFMNCSRLMSISLPSSLNSIGQQAFYACIKLTDAVIPEGVTTIGNAAFCGCDNLKNAIISSSVTSIGTEVFSRCEKLMNIYVDTQNSVYCDRDGVVFNKSGTELISFPNGRQGEYIIPTSVTSIGYSAFSNCDGLTKIAIPSGVTTIGPSAFAYCRALTSISIPESVINIGQYAFISCSNLTDVVIPSGITCIEASAFHGCSSLTSIAIPASVTSIGRSAFMQCTNLSSMAIPSGVSSIDSYAFAYCDNLTNITVPVSITSIDEYAFYNCSRLTDVYYTGTEDEWNVIEKGEGNEPLINAEPHFNYVIPMLSKVTVNISEAEGGQVFLNYNKTSLAVQNETVVNCNSGEVLSIQGVPNTGYSCQISATMLSDGTEIPLSTLADGTRSFVVPASDVELCVEFKPTLIIFPSGTWGTLSWILDNEGELTISGTGNMDDFIYSSNSEDAWYPYHGSIKSIVIQPGVMSIGAYAFSNCHNLTSTTLPESLTYIGSNAFYGCGNLTEVTIPEGVTGFGEDPFSSGLINIKVDPANTVFCDLDGVLFNKSKDTIVYYPYGRSGRYEIPEGTLHIGNSAFWNCFNLTGVSIPESVSDIGKEAFFGCDGLTSVTIPGSVKNIGDDAFSNCHNLISVTLLKGVLIIGKEAFFHCPSLTSVSIPESVTAIGESAFISCSSLSDVTIPGSVSTIGESAFYDCSALTNVTILEGAGSIGENAFRSCTSLTNLTLPGSVSMIGTAAFVDCSSLINVTIQEGVGRIGKDAFRNCTSLTSLRLPGSVSTIGEAAFMDCSAVTSITMLEGVTDIGGHAFRNCGSLVSVEIPSSVTTIGYAAFYNCSKLKTVYYGGTQTQWRAISIGSYNPKLTDATKYYISDGTEANYSEMVSGILQSGDGWQIKWEVLYNIVSGVKTDAFLKIYIEGVNTTDTAIPLYCLYPERENIFTMPWLTDFQKSDFEKIYIQGSIDNPFEIVSSQFSGYNKVQTVQLDFVETLQSNAFSDCISLETVIFDGWLDYIGNGAFRNDSSLHKLYNRSKINKFETIGDEAFMNTGLTSFDFHSALKTIGDRAFIGSQLTSVEIGPNVTSIGEDAFDHSIKIWCYPNSAAHQYAEEGNIDYRFIDTPEKAVVYSDNHGSYSVQFGPNVLSIPSTAGVYNKDMAVLCGMLCQASYGDHGTELEKIYRQMFKGTDLDIVIDYVDDAFCSGIALAEMVVDGRETNVLVITVRGTKNWRSELYADLSKSTTDMWGNETYSEIINFQNRVLSNLNELLARHPDFADKPVIIIVTGHSLGGAAANLLSAMFTRNLSSSPENIWTAITTQSDIYGYTFGAVDVLSPNSNGMSHPIKNGFENIHNIFNIYDEIASSSDFIRGSGLAGEGKYGHMDYYARDNRDNMFNMTENHEMYRYLEAVATAWVGEQQM